ncbi:FAD-dependent oxidoreductase [Nocardia jinanensis]|uniref:FAD-dependent oxidoreductase n=1 Tax=Nocardia jinanensis TaxID=382504 RepID=A0A917RST0_9NOCA|nr:FAD-dependent oxidoreductase [Nocardia jinanensis]
MREPSSVDTEVIIVGAGPTGLMLAAELGLAGVRPLILEKYPQPRTTQKAQGLGGQILRLLHYRGLLERIEAAVTAPEPPQRYPFGGVHVDLIGMVDPPLRGLPLPQTRLEELLAERVDELGADIRRGHEVVGVSQDDTSVTAEVSGPDGPYRITARYLVGCDGGRSPIREMAGIAFTGTTYPEVNRLCQVTVPDSVTRLDNGDIEVPGIGRISTGFTRTERGAFGFGSPTPDMLMFSTTEDESTDIADDEPMTPAEFQDSVRRVLGTEIPLGETLRLARFTFKDRHAETYRAGRILVAGDAAHLLPATGSGLNTGLLDAVNLAWKLAADVHGWAPAGLVDSYHEERHYAGDRALRQTRAQVALRRGLDPAADALREVVQELLGDEQSARRVAGFIAGTDVRYDLPNPNRHPSTGTFAPDLALRTGDGATTVADLLHTARPVLLDLADRPELREVAREWADRIDIHTATTDDRPADALLIRPDAHIAWAATVGEPADSAVAGLRAALSGWFGAPDRIPVLAADQGSEGR